MSANQETALLSCADNRETHVLYPDIDKTKHSPKGRPIRNDHKRVCVCIGCGKEYLRKKLSAMGELYLTTGGDTANKRIDWTMERSHGNDAICVTNCKPGRCDVTEWTIKPMRRKSKAKTDQVVGIRHRDLVSYMFGNEETHTGYVTALYPDLNALNFQSHTKHCKKVNARKCRLLWRYHKIYWLKDKWA